MELTRTELTGLDDLEAQLAEIGKEAATKLGQVADRAAARVLAKAMSDGAPHAPGVQLKVYTAKDGSVRRTDYGELKDNIRVRRARVRTEGYVVYEVTTGRAFWGFFREFGTLRQPAKPWARPIVEQVAPTLPDVMIKVLNAGIERIARRKARAAARGE